MANYKLTERTKKDKDGNIKGIEKCIIVDFVNLTENERQAVEMYVKGGYTLHAKKEKANPKPKKERVKLSKDIINDYLKDYEDKASKELKGRMKTKENFMTLQTYFKDIYFEYPAEADKQKIEKRAEYYKQNYKKGMKTEERKAFIDGIKNI